MAAIGLDGVTKRFGNVVALPNVDLSVALGYRRFRAADR